MESALTDQSNPTTRRTILIGAALSGLPLLAAGTAANAAGTVPQATAKYQNHPQGANQCSKCNYFLAGATPTGPAKCKLVAGVIMPNGWCTLFAAKRA